MTENEQFFIFQDKEPVKPSHVRTILRKLFDNLRLNSIVYGTHSFRIGRTSDLIKYGYNIETVKLMGRWKSNAIYKYIK